MLEWFDWFELTHTVVAVGGSVRWQRQSLPAAGGVQDQPALLMEALALLARTHNALLAGQRPARPPRRPQKPRRG